MIVQLCTEDFGGHPQVGFGEDGAVELLVRAAEASSGCRGLQLRFLSALWSVSSLHPHNR